MIRADALPRLMVADFVGGLLAGLVVALYRGVVCALRADTPDR